MTKMLRARLMKGWRGLALAPPTVIASSIATATWLAIAPVRYQGNCEWDLAAISRQEAEQIAAGLAADHWPPDAARLPWVASAYPQ